MCAARNNRLEVSKLLIDKGADIHLQDNVSKKCNAVEWVAASRVAVACTCVCEGVWRVWVVWVVGGSWSRRQRERRDLTIFENMTFSDLCMVSCVQWFATDVCLQICETICCSKDIGRNTRQIRNCMENYLGLVYVWEREGSTLLVIVGGVISQLINLFKSCYSGQFLWKIKARQFLILQEGFTCRLLRRENIENRVYAFSSNIKSAMDKRETWRKNVKRICAWRTPLPLWIETSWWFDSLLWYWRISFKFTYNC